MAVVKHPDVLVVAAWQPEMEELERWLRRDKRHARLLACRTVGIGAIDAAVGTTLALVELRPRALVYLGTAGAYPLPRDGESKAPPIDTAVVARDLMLVPTGALDNVSYLPTPINERAPTDAGLRERLCDGGMTLADVACPLGVTRSTRLGKRIAAATGALVENLEAFAVARAAAAASVPFAAVLGISNRVGPRSHPQWERHRGAAAAAACQVVERMLTAPTRAESLSA